MLKKLCRVVMVTLGISSNLLQHLCSTRAQFEQILTLICKFSILDGLLYTHTHTHTCPSIPGSSLGQRSGLS